MERMRDESVSTAALEQFYAQLKAGGTQLHALEVFEKGKCLVRWGMAPYSCADKRECYSLSKSFMSTAVGLAFDRGLLSPDDLLSRYFPQQVAAQPDERWKRVRLRHLLSMTIGHSTCPMVNMALAPDSIEGFFQAPLVFEPGEHFAYNTGAGCVLGEIVHQVTGFTAQEFLMRELFSAMDIKNIWWEGCADGRCQGGTGLKASCDDVAKLGLLYCQKGMWNGRRLLSEEWIGMAGSFQASTEQNGTRDWRAGYGFQFWQNHHEGYRGDGAFGQLCIILPERETVAVVMAESADMQNEIDCVWKLLEQLHTAGEGKGLPYGLRPRPGEETGSFDSGWLRCSENPMGFTSLRAVEKDGVLELTLCDAQRTQTICAKAGEWVIQDFFAKELRPTLYRQMPRAACTCMHMACAYRREGERLILECRVLNTPHRVWWNIRKEEHGLTIGIESPLDVVGAAREWHAVQ